MLIRKIELLMEWLPVQIVKPARKSWKILLLEYCSPMSQVYCAGNKATVAPLGWAHHIIDIYRLQKIYNKWVRWGFCEVDIQVETCGAMKRACRGISSFVRGGNCISKLRKEKASQTNIDLVRQWSGCYCCIDLSSPPCLLATHQVLRTGLSLNVQSVKAFTVT